MLRLYDEIGLLEPKSTDRFTSYRYYGEEQLAVAVRIQSLKDMGFGLSAISEILKSYDNPQKLAEFLEVKKAEVRADISQSKTKLLLLETAVKRLRKDNFIMKFDVVIKTIPELYVASVRNIIPNYEDEGILWQTLMSEIAPLNIKDTNPCYTLAIFHDKEYKESDVDVEVHKSVSGKYTNTKNVKFKTISPIKVASCTYKGGYENMDSVNQAVADWINNNGYDFDGAAFNIYHVSPHETQNTDDFVTEVCYPVCRK